jgi:hypothetical protein
MSLDVEIFRNVLREEFEENYDDFNDIIIDTHCLIAGGSVLAAYTNGRINDFDIYVHKSHAKVLKDRLIDLLGYQFNVYNNYLRPAYDESFFRKNGILARFSLSNDLNRYLYPIDIMIIPDNIPLRRVVQNFDFTFCEIWYDGNSVNATNPGQVLIKKGFMRKDYVKTLLTTFNKFLIDRITKYRYKGFTITYECSVDNSFIIQANPTNQRGLTRRIVTKPEEWVVSKIYKGMLIFVASISKPETMLRTLAGVLPSILNRFISITEERILAEYAYDYICDNQIVYSMASLNNLMYSLGINDPDEIKLVYMRALNSNFLYLLPLTSRFMEYITESTGITSQDLNELYSADHPGFLINNQNYDEEDSEGEDEDSEEESDDEEEEEFVELETINIDENTLPQNCFDFVMYDEENITDYLNDESTNFIFVMIDHDGNFGDIICASREYVSRIIDDKFKYFYECAGPYIGTTQDRSMGRGVVNFPYVKFPLDRNDFNGFIPLNQLKAILRNNYKVYYVLPKMENGEHKLITHTVGWENYLQPARNRRIDATVSANHCQHGSSILIYEIKVCRDPERCIRSIIEEQKDDDFEEEHKDDDFEEEHKDDDFEEKHKDDDFEEEHKNDDYE